VENKTEKTIYSKLITIFASRKVYASQLGCCTLFIYHHSC